MTSKARKPTVDASSAMPIKSGDKASGKQARPIGRGNEKTEAVRRWLVEHAAAIRAENEDIEKNGLPLAKYRTF